MTHVVTNPLDLPLHWRSGIEPLHDAHDDVKLATLTTSMEAHGWQGPPLVGSGELAAYGQDRAYTGSHRLQAWKENGHGAAPCVYIEDLCEACGISWGALVAEHGDDYEAVMSVIYALPADVCEAYGLDCGGAL